MMHEIEDSVLHDLKVSTSGLVEWIDRPSRVGQNLDLFDFFMHNPYGQINNEHPIELNVVGNQIVGKWRRSSETIINRNILLDPLWCYVAGLYLAEGSTPKKPFFVCFHLV